MKRSCCLLALLLAALAWGEPVVRAQGGGWDKPVEVSSAQKTRSSWFPDLAVAPDGSVHIVWSSGITREDKPGQPRILDLLMYRSLRNGQWSEINDIDQTGEGGYTVRNSIVMGRDGQLHVLVRQHLTTYAMRAPWTDAWSARAWTGIPITRDGTYYNALAVDSKGRLHAIWTEAVPDKPGVPSVCKNCSDIFYRRSDDGGQTWTAPINLSQSPEGSTKPQIKVDKNDGVHVVWEEGFDWYVTQGVPTAGAYRYSPDGGQSWEPTVRMTLPPFVPPPPPAAPGAPPEPTPAPIEQAPIQMTLGLIDHEQPLLVYRSNVTDKVYFQRSEDRGRSWTPPAAIPRIVSRDYNDGYTDEYAMVTDGDGRVHLFLAGFLEGDTDPTLDLKPTDQRNRPRLLHLIFERGRWSGPEVVFTDTDYPGYAPEVTAACDAIAPSRSQMPRVLTPEQKETFSACRAQERYPEWPRAVIQGDRLYLTWFTRNSNDLHDSEKGGYQVWYASRTLDSRPVTPPPQFTPTPAPVATAAPATPAPAPTPTLAPAERSAPPIDAAPAWEQSGLAGIVMAVLPVLGFLALLIGMLAVIRSRRPRR
jgi:hypothetical protein